MDCGCSPTYQPVCDQTARQTYFSPCSAGCETRLNSSTFLDCSCLASPSSSLVAGYCPSDCNTPLMAFLVTQFLLNFILGLGRIGNLLVHVRCVEESDKVWSTLIGRGMSRLVSHWSRAILVMLAPAI